MRVVFAGAHGVGKSTLMDLLINWAPELQQYPRFDSFGRKLKKKYGLRATQRKFNYFYTYKHYITKDFISARTIYDTWAYSRVFVGPWFNYRLFSWAIRYVYYDYVFYVPIEFPLEEDGIRPDTATQYLMDRELHLILDFYHIPYHTLTGTIQERMEKIGGILPLEYT